MCDRAEAVFLHSLEKDLQAELDLLLKQEEIHWFQKSRTDWINDGDRNTRYYHVRTISRRRRSKVEMLKGEDGEWVEDLISIKAMVVQYFNSLFKREVLSGSYDEIVRGFTSLYP